MASVRVLKREEEHALHRRWAGWAREALDRGGVEWPLLSALAAWESGAVPGFVCPPPSVTDPDLGTELAGMRAQDPGHVRRALEEMPGLGGPHVRALYRDPASGLARLADEIVGYWEAVLAPFWPRMLVLLEGEVLYRSRQLAEGGAEALFRDLDASVAWRGETLHVSTVYTPPDQVLGGRGLLLAPSVFAWPQTYHIVDRDFQPTLRYPPRGVGTLWERRPADAPQRLGALIGRTRARILAELRSPMSGKALAERTGLTRGAVSQHMSALRGAGLTRAHRYGRHVLHVRTRLGEELLDASSRPREGPRS
ncbi:ArsR/SmtB family transcription factor [Nocardiopsis baichengensis]|uniref:ArsR/SmtB family transcription factor n=1 Tax=Nocardiopsis baichengensis TaxID=280240 RepID=UPI0003457969|nr:winged helix-turn-helix domain-containing protein [Nocardiopsis baichengensis]